MVNVMRQTGTKREFFASLHHLHEMLDFIRQEASQSGAQASSIGHIEIASEEALVNIVHYSYPQHEGNIQIACTDDRKDREFRVTIEDQGIPYNPVACMRAPSHNAPSIDDHSIGGYGIFLMLQLMDKVDYFRHEDRNELLLTKYY